MKHYYKSIVSFAHRLQFSSAPRAWVAVTQSVHLHSLFAMDLYTVYTVTQKPNTR